MTLSDKLWRPLISGDNLLLFSLLALLGAMATAAAPGLVMFGGYSMYWCVAALSAFAVPLAVAVAHGSFQQEAPRREFLRRICLLWAALLVPAVLAIHQGWLYLPRL